MGKEILRERKIPRNELLDEEKSQGNDSKFTFNSMCYRVFRHLKNQLKEFFVILACVEGHKKVFPEVPITEVDRCEPCGGKRSPSQLSSNMKNTSTFKGKHSNEVYKINTMVIYLIEFRVCRKQYNSSTVTKFRARVNNYKSIHRNFWKEQKLSNQTRNQKRYRKHYLENDHNEICDWEIRIINHAEKEKFLRQKELY